MKLPKHAELWFPAYLRGRVQNLLPKRPAKRLRVAITDHYEPWGGNVSAQVAAARLAAWQERWPAIAAAAPQDAAGRSPDARIVKLAKELPGVEITGSVPDMRPYMWGATVSIVPIRIGGGTRLKIYECMAAGLPVVSTTIGAEGLSYTPDKDIVIADSPTDFAAACLRLIAQREEREAIADEALALVTGKFSWAAVTNEFEAILEANRIQAGAA